MASWAFGKSELVKKLAITDVPMLGRKDFIKPTVVRPLATIRQTLWLNSQRCSSGAGSQLVGRPDDLDHGAGVEAGQAWDREEVAVGAI